MGGESGGGGACCGGVEQDGGGVAGLVRHSYIWFPVAVDVAAADEDGFSASCEGDLGGESGGGGSCGGSVEQDGDVAGLVRHSYIWFPVAVDVAAADEDGFSASCEGDLGGESGAGGSCGGSVEQDGDVAGLVRHSYIWFPVAVDVADADGAGIASREGNLGGESGAGGSCGGSVEQDGDVAAIVSHS